MVCLLLEPRTDTNRVAVRVSDMALSYVPGHFGRWPGSHDAEFQRERIDFIDLGRRIKPPCHPRAAGLIVPGLAWHRSAACALPALAEKDFGRAGDDRAEGWWMPMVPMLFPSEPLEPGKALLQARDVQNRR